MPVTVAIDPNFIYAMLFGYYYSVLSQDMGNGTTLSSSYFTVLDGDTEVRRFSLDCYVSAVTGGAKITCTRRDTTSDTYTVNGAAFRFTISGVIYELFKISFSSVTKGSGDFLTVTATAVLTAG